MNYRECIELIAGHWTDELVVTSAGTTTLLWYDITKDTEKVFYLDASMSLSTLFAAGIAFGVPDTQVWAFMGDGAFAMNPGTLMVERRMNLPNLKHFMVSNRAYGSTSNVPLPGRESSDYVAIARGFGIERAYCFRTLNELEGGFADAVTTPGHAFIHLEVDPMGKEAHAPRMDGPEVKFRFGRHVERTTGRKIFDLPLNDGQGA